MSSGNSGGSLPLKLTRGDCSHHHHHMEAPTISPTLQSCRRLFPKSCGDPVPARMEDLVVGGSGGGDDGKSKIFTSEKPG